MKINSCLILFLMLCSSCQQKPEASAESKIANDSNQTKRNNDAVFKYVEAFKGTLPCADCPGIVTEITFINDNLLYHETDTYMERNVTNQLTGSYTTDRGYKEDDDATVYVLDDDKRGHERRFLKLNDSTILMLDGKVEIIHTTLNYQLYRVK